MKNWRPQEISLPKWKNASDEQKKSWRMQYPDPRKMPLEEAGGEEPEAGGDGIEMGDLGDQPVADDDDLQEDYDDRTDEFDDPEEPVDKTDIGSPPGDKDDDEPAEEEKPEWADIYNIEGPDRNHIQLERLDTNH